MIFVFKSNIYKMLISNLSLENIDVKFKYICKSR